MAYDSAFAEVYDTFTQNTEVEKRTAFLHALLCRFGIKDGILLDLACGTAKLSEAFIKLGYDVICTDASYNMLTKARERLEKYGNRALILSQDMRELDLFGTIHACICTLDSINHITDKREVQTVFDRVSLFTEPDGVFIFDVNTVYKHREILGNNTFVYENDTDFLVWQNDYNPSDNTVQMTIDIFTFDGNQKYTRASEDIVERAYETDEIIRMLKKAGFRKTYCFGDLKDSAPVDTEERIYFAAIK